MSHLKEKKPINSFTTELPADEVEENYVRIVKQAAFSFVKPTPCKNPELIIISDELAKELEIEDVESSSFLQIVSGNETIEGFKPYAMCYGGHQFGVWAGQLGDGRAINILDTQINNKPYSLQLKGAGLTPYSRSADGKAVLRSSIREFLCSEAMFHLGVPTTRALSLVLTGENVLRDKMYDGNPEYEKGAIVCRVALNFIRFGNFEIFAARQDVENLKKLTDYTIKHFFPKLNEGDYLTFFKTVAARTMDMIIEWQRVGFVHGVMNTDNMSILGLTIDYGPYGWIDNFDLGWTPNTTDAQEKRYRFGNQINIAFWNLTQLANALFPLINDVAALEQILEETFQEFDSKYVKMLNQKIGLQIVEANDKKMQMNLFALLEKANVDMTLFYRKLVDFDTDNPTAFVEICKQVSYLNDTTFQSIENELIQWLNEYAIRLQKENLSKEERKKKMNTINPKYVLRNYMAQLAIEDAEKGNYALLNELFSLLKHPYDEQPEMEKWFVKRPDWALNKVGSSKLSCSS